MDPHTQLSFSDFPEDVQLTILSFLNPSDLSTFSCTSKRFVSLCHSSNTKLWYTMCERRWGSHTLIHKWSHNGKIPYKHLYKTLSEWENLIGFWRRSGQNNNNNNKIVESPPLIFFEWGDSFISGSRIAASRSGDYGVVKTPFLWMGLMGSGEIVNILDPDGRIHGLECVDFDSFDNGCLLHVNVSFMGKNHVVVEENLSYLFVKKDDDANLMNVGSSDEVVMDREEGMLDMYRYFANRTSPVRDRVTRRQRRRDREKKRRWEVDHFVKIVNSSPTPSRPLQGLWKGICDDMSLDFYLVSYDEMGGLTCRKVGDSCQPFSDYSPVFWTPNTRFIESPFSPEEEYIYDSRMHLRPNEAAHHNIGKPLLPENEVVSRILYINSSYDLVIPDLAASVNTRHVEGRIWQYEDATFGFGFLRDDFIIDLKHIAHNGRLLDAV